MGTGVFLGEVPEPARERQFPAGDVTLNFEATSLREFVKVIFEDILQENYLIDPKVDGVVTLHTTRPVSGEAVLSIVESVLELNGAVLVQDRGIYRIVPVAAAEGESVSPMVGKRAPGTGAGYGVQIIPLKHGSAAEIESILKPFVPAGTTLRVDATRNLLILSGPRYRLDHLVETIKVFDVDWLKGMSFGMFPLHYADATVLVDGRGDDYREYFVGFNLFLYGHRFKWQTGLQYTRMKDNANDGGDYDGWGLTSGLRIYW